MESYLTEKMRSTGSILLLIIAAAIWTAPGCRSSETVIRDSTKTDDSRPGKLSAETNAYHVDTTRADTATAPPQEVTIPRQHALSLSMTSYVVPDTAEYHSFRLYVQNAIDSAAIIDRVEPSCGCFLVTVQKSIARKGHDAEIYIAVTLSKMSETQPYTVDIYTNQNPSSPLRLWLWKGKALGTEGTK